MRRAAIIVALLALEPARQSVAFQFPASVYDEVKPSILRVSCADRAATGFLWTTPDTAVTALHVVSGCGTVTVYYEGQRVQRTATVVKVLRRADLALLKISDAPTARVLQLETSAPALTESLSTLGFPLQVRSMTNTSLQLRYGGKTLRDIIPESVAQTLSGGSPSLDLEINSIEGHLLPGHSGAPVFNVQRRVVAIADGGLENGAAAVSWGIPAKFLNQLSASNENPATPQAGGRRTALFAAETESMNRGETTCSGMTITKVRTTSFAQASMSADDPRGLMQLIQFFQVDPTSFRFDVYQHLPSGATMVLPADARVQPAPNGDCNASLQSGKVTVRMELGILGSPTEANDKSLAFERSLAGANNSGWVPDAQWTYLMPVPRFDGMVVRRRAYQHVQTVPVMFQDRFVFEALAVRHNVFIGSAAMYSWSLDFAQRFNTCRMAPNSMGCQEAFTFISDWVRSVLAIQLTTFPIG
jgi:S1-C subfamily serine protease